MNPILMKILGIQRTTHHVSIGVKQVIYRFSLFKWDVAVGKLENTLE